MKRVRDVPEESREKVKEGPDDPEGKHTLDPGRRMKGPPSPGDGPPHLRRCGQTGSADEFAIVLGDTFRAEKTPARRATRRRGAVGVDRAFGFGEGGAHAASDGVAGFSAADSSFAARRIFFRHFPARISPVNEIPVIPPNKPVKTP